MADINVYGKLHAATGDGLVADATQIKYNNTTVKTTLDNISNSGVSNADTVDGWHVNSETGKSFHKSGYVSINTALSSYWIKVANIPFVNVNNSVNVTFHFSCPITKKYGIISVIVRKDISSYTVNVYNIAGNMTSEHIRLYYEDDSLPAELWVNVEQQWGICNTLILSETKSAGYESGDSVTLEHGSFSTILTPTLSNIANFRNLVTETISTSKSADSDKLDGKHLNEIFNGFGRNNSDTLSLQIGDVTKSIISPSMYYWSVKCIHNQYSRCVILNRDASYIFSVTCAQVSQVFVISFLVSLSYNSITIFQIGSDDYSNNSNIKIRGVKLSTDQFAIDILNPFRHSDMSDKNYIFACKLMRIGGAGNVNTTDTSIGTSPTVNDANVLTEITSTHTKYLANLVFSDANVTTEEDNVLLELKKENDVVLDMQIPAATTSKAGVMSMEDKLKLDNLSTDATFKGVSINNNTTNNQLIFTKTNNTTSTVTIPTVVGSGSGLKAGLMTPADKVKLDSIDLDNIGGSAKVTNALAYPAANVYSVPVDVAHIKSVSSSNNTAVASFKVSMTSASGSSFTGKSCDVTIYVEYESHGAVNNVKCYYIGDSTVANKLRVWYNTNSSNDVILSIFGSSNERYTVDLLSEIYTDGSQADIVTMKSHKNYTAGGVTLNSYVYPVNGLSLDDNSVNTSTIANNAVTNAKLAANSVGTTQLKDSSVSDAKLTSGIYGSKLKDNSVTVDKLDKQYADILKALPSIYNVEDYLTADKILPYYYGTVNGIVLCNKSIARVRSVSYGSNMDDYELYVASYEVNEADYAPNVVFKFVGNSTKGGWAYDSVLHTVPDDIKKLFGANIN